MPAQVLKLVVYHPLEDVGHVAWSCWPIGVWHTGLIVCLGNHLSMVAVPAVGTLGSIAALLRVQTQGPNCLHLKPSCPHNLGLNSVSSSVKWG